MKNTTIFRYSVLFGLMFQTGSAMAQTYAPGACSLVPGSQTCVDTTPCKTSATGTPVCLAGAAVPTGGVSIPQTCWQYSYQYACASITPIDTCSTYKNDPNCQVIGSSCQDTTAATGQCNEWQYTYQCQTQAAQTQQQLVCGINALTMPTPSNPNNTFPQAAVAQELLNEGGTYLSNGLLFGGVAETCTKGYYGLKNCCKSAPGANPNSVVTQLAFGAAASVVKYAGSAAVDWASPYVYDAMFSAQNYLAGLANSTSVISMPLGTNYAASGFSFGAYGFTYSTVAPAAVSGISGGTVIAGTSTASGGYGVIAFNPYVFAAMVAIAVIQDLMACTTEEQLLSMHKGAGLSTYINEYCSNNVFLLGCMEYTDNFCSFNSVLAEIINIQGKTQLGLNISNCQGITPAQLSQIDFSKVDFKQFTQSLLQNAQNHAPTSTSMSNGYTPILQNATQGSSQSTKSNALPAY
jgi:conjugal transfer mating pair stabilization protein TraN